LQTFWPAADTLGPINDLIAGAAEACLSGAFSVQTRKKQKELSVVACHQSNLPFFVVVVVNFLYRVIC